MKKLLLILAITPILSLSATDLSGPIQGEYVALERQARGGEAVEVLTDANFSEKTAVGYSVVDFYADWCGPCRTYGPKFVKVAHELNGLLSFYKVNIDLASKTTSAAKIQAIPTTVLYKDGVEIKRVIGGLTEQSLRDFILSEVSE